MHGVHQQKGNDMRRKISLFCLSAGLLLSGMISCGTTAISISPAGPVTVQKGSTQQFTANQGVSWSVNGGDSNGTIDANGLFTPPSTLPPNPQVTVTATAGSQTTTALVNLRTGNTLSISGSPQAISTSSTQAYLLLPFQESQYVGFSNRLAARVVGSNLLLSAIWNYQDLTPGSFITGVNSYSSDFGDFSTPLITTTAGSNEFNTNVHIGSDGTFYLLSTQITPTSSGQHYLYLQTSTNGGQSYGSLSVVDSTNPSLDKSQISSRIDANDNLHVFYGQTDNLGAPTYYNLYYTRSSNSASTWSTPVSVATGAPSDILLLPAIAVDPTGNNIDLCWNNSSTVFYSTSSDGGQTFSTPAVVTSSGIVCSVGRDSSNNVYLSYAQFSAPYPVVVRKLSAGGSAFSDASAVFSSSTTYSFPRLVIDSLDRITVVMGVDNNADSVPDNVSISRSTDAGATFTPTNNVLPSGITAAMFYGVQDDISGRIHLTYEATSASSPTSITLLETSYLHLE